MKRNLVSVVGLGPGDAQFLTAQARHALQEADVLCGYTVYIDLVRPLYPEKETYATGMTREIDRCRWALQTAQTGKTVALVCSGDAGVYGMASPLLELAAEYPDVEVEVVPGLTAALSGAAVLGAPLAHDFCVISLSDRLTPWEMIEKRLACAAMGDFCVALYNPSSKGRPDYLQKAVRILLQNGKGAGTLCGVVRSIGRTGQQSSQMTLAELETHHRGYVHHGVHRQQRHPPGQRVDGNAAGVPRGMRIVVFSGTTEGRDFSRAAAALGIAVTVSVATDLGAEEQGQAPGITVHSGRLLPGAMAELLQGAALCVDATHPYAVEATKNIRAAANAAGVEYHRLLRAASTLPAGSVVLADAARAAAYLARQTGARPAGDGCQGAARLRSARPGAALPARSADAGRYRSMRGSGRSAPQYPCDAGTFYERIKCGAAAPVPYRLYGHEGRRRGGRLCRKGRGRRPVRRAAHCAAPPGRRGRDRRHNFTAMQGAFMKIILVGMGSGAPGSLTAAGLETLRGAELIIGARRLLET